MRTTKTTHHKHKPNALNHFIMNTIAQNRDFLFLYEAKHTNPNGDPDNENKPRMDAATQTNLVSDVRLKRYIRDYLKQRDEQIFVDMQGNSKVGMDTRLKSILIDKFNDEDAAKNLLKDDYTEFQKHLSDQKGSVDDLLKAMTKKNGKLIDFNQRVLTRLVQQDFIDIRMFGSAFAIEGFNRAITGPIQLAWGYSLNKVHLLESNTISSIMNDGNSTFGRDHRVKYSLIAFQGTINAAAARHTGLTEEDVARFREAIWAGVSANPTRSKINQYPLLYVEFTYRENEPNGSLGDLRRYLEVEPTVEDKAVSDLDDLKLDFTRLYRQREDDSVESVYERAAGRLDYQKASV